jgi:CHASE2 domain-containing sensor protein
VQPPLREQRSPALPDHPQPPVLPPPEPVAPAWLRPALRIVALWMIGYTFFIFHGISSHLTPWSQAFINAMVKFTYGGAGQRETTVVLFREDNLRHLDVQYPVPYRMHAQIVEAIASYRPRAVFIDFAFIDSREDPDIAELSAQLCALRDANPAGPTPVFLAAPAGTTVRKELLRCALPVSPEMDEATGASGVLTYGSRGGKDGPSTAAFALAATNQRLRLDARSMVKPLEIIWGKGVDALNRRWMRCEDLSLVASVRAVLKHGPLATKLACPYTRTITVGHLLNFASDKDVEAAVKGQTVLYGAGFRLTGDQVDSPVYEQLPGVYLHAMAYDNLVTFGSRYKRAEHDTFGAWVFNAVFLLLSSILLVGFPRHEPRRAETFAELKAAIRRGAAWGLLVALAVVGIAWAWGFDAGLLAVFAVYFVYRWRVAKDTGFVALALIMVVVSLFAYYVQDIGPRNILAFLVFFEVVRHLEKHLKEGAERYFELRGGPSVSTPRMVWRALDGFLSLYAPAGSAPTDHREGRHGETKSHIAR